MTRALQRRSHQAALAVEPDMASPWKSLLDGMPLAAWVVSLDEQRPVVAANAPACELLQRTLPELLGAPAATLLATPEDLAWWDALDAADPDSLRSNTVLCGPDGTLLHVERWIRPLAGPHGTARGAGGNGREGDAALAVVITRAPMCLAS